MMTWVVEVAEKMAEETMIEHSGIITFFTLHFVSYRHVTSPSARHSGIQTLGKKHQSHPFSLSERPDLYA